MTEIEEKKEVRSKKIYEPFRRFKAQEIIEIRNHLGLSQEKFAMVLGCHADSLRSWEQDKREIPGGQARLLELFLIDNNLIKNFERK